MLPIQEFKGESTRPSVGLELMSFIFAVRNLTLLVIAPQNLFVSFMSLRILP